MKFIFVFLIRTAALIVLVGNFKFTLAQEYKPLHKVIPHLYTMPATKMDIGLINLKEAVKQTSENIQFLLEGTEEGYKQFGYGVYTKFGFGEPLKIYVNYHVSDKKYVTKSNCVKILSMMPYYLQFADETDPSRFNRFSDYFFIGSVAFEENSDPDSIRGDLKKLMNETVLQARVKNIDRMKGYIATEQACQMELSSFKVLFHKKPY